MKKRIGILLVFLMLIGTLAGFGETAWAAAGKTSIAVSKGTLNIGDTVTVTVRATTESGGSALATMTLSYDAGILEFVSCSASTYGGGGGSVTVPTDSFSVTLKAISAGTSSLTLSASDGVNFDTNEELESMEGSSASVTVNNAASNPGESTGGNTGGNTGGSAGGNTAVLSADNSLKTLSISPGTLSPAFSGSNVNYTATVANDVTSVAVNAVPVNQKATVESVSGNTSLSVGTNDVKIVVKAENGTTATYTIKITRQAAGTTEPPVSPGAEEPGGAKEPEEDLPTEGEIAVNGSVYKIVSAVPEEVIPADFTPVTVNCRGNSYQGLSFNKGTMSLLFLKGAGEEGQLYIYDETRDTIYDFAKLASPQNYVIPLLAPVDFTVPEQYLQTSFQTAEGRSVTAYQGGDASGFYLFYGVNRDGTEGWYQYDGEEGTYQRARNAFADTASETESENERYLQEQYNKLSDKYRDLKTSSRNTIAVLGIVIALLFILILNLVIFGWRKIKMSTGDDDWDSDEDELEEEETPEPKKQQKKRTKREKINSDDLEEEPEEETEEEVRGKEFSYKGASHKAVSYKETLRSGALHKESGHKKETLEKSNEKKDIDVIDFNDL